MILNLKKIAKENERYALKKNKFVFESKQKKNFNGKHLPSIPGAPHQNLNDFSETQGPIFIDGFLHQTHHLLKSNQTKVRKLEFTGSQNLK